MDRAGQYAALAYISYPDTSIQNLGLMIPSVQLNEGLQDKFCSSAQIVQLYSNYDFVKIFSQNFRGTEKQVR